MHLVVKIEGIIHSDQFQKMLVKLTERHEPLRTSFGIEGKQFVQVINENPQIDYTYEVVKGEIEEKKLYENFAKNFDLRTAPLLRSKLVQTEKDAYVIVEIHHLIADGASLNILWKDMEAIYFEKNLNSPNIQYKDYGAWQDKKSFVKEEMYWLKEFESALPTVNLVTDFPRPQKKNFEGIHVLTELAGSLKEKTAAILRQTEATEFIVMLSIFVLFLKKHTHQNDLVIGIPVSNRLHMETYDLLGMFINTLAIRINLSDDMTFLDLVNAVKDKCYLAYENREYPFEQLVGQLNVKRDASRNPVFDVMFSQEDAYEGLTFGKFQISVIPQPSFVSPFDLSIAIIKGKQKDSVSLTLSKSLFREETAYRMARQYAMLVDHVCAYPMKLVSDDFILDEEVSGLATEASYVMAMKHPNHETCLKRTEEMVYESIEQLLHFNHTWIAYPKDRMIHQLFEKQVAQVPDDVALILGEERMTYKALNEKSNQLARSLRSNGIGSNCLVGMMMERSFEMMVGILGVLKSGGAYLPIEPEHPKEWIRFILEESGTPILLTQSWLNKNIEFEGKRMNLDDERIYQGRCNDLKTTNNSEDLACVLYTSGSTGKPKGVMITHKSVVNLLFDLERRYPLKPGDAYLFKTAYTFDVSVTELFGWLIAGEKVVILQPGDEKQPGKIREAIGQHRITHLNFVPSMLRVFLEALKDRLDRDFQTIKYTFVSGEVLKQDVVTTYYTLFKGSRLENIYGSTETSHNTRYTTVMNEQHLTVPIGQPFANVSFYILDQNRSSVPIGIPGEVYISGDSLAKGYLNRPDLTAEKFVSNPFIPGMKMYRTGDLARWLPDGNIEYLGRIDQQVKIRGFRIELGEIESKMREFPGVQESAVMIKERNGIKLICAYYKSEVTYEFNDLKQTLMKGLPEYMIPHYFIRVDDFLYTKSGKLDKKALLDMKWDHPNGVENLKSEAEIVISDIFKQVLGVEQAGREAKFLELGGDSLTAIKMSHLIEKKLNDHLQIKDILVLNSVKNMASKLEIREKKGENHDVSIATATEILV